MSLKWILIPAVILILIFLFSSCNPLGKVVNQDISNNHYYTKDKKDVYFSRGGNWFALGKTLLEVDVKTLEVQSPNFCKDGTKAYFERHLIPPEAIDIHTFEPVKGDYSFDIAKDKNNVYWFEHGNEIRVLEGADPATFEVLDLDFEKDSKTVFYIKNATTADPASFNRINKHFSKDKTQTYYHGRGSLIAFPAEVSSLAALEGDYAYDNSSVYYRSNPVSDSAAYSVTTIPYSNRDDLKVLQTNHLLVDDQVYYQDQLIPEADRASFEFIDYSYGKDAKQVFFQGKVVEGADPASFHFDNGSSRYVDAKHSYRRGEVVVKEEK